MFYLFFMYCIVAMLVTFFINDKDIFSPSFLVAFSFFISSLFGLFNYALWDLGTFSIKTASILIIGLSLFILNDILVKYLTIEKKRKTIRSIYIKRWKTIIVIIFMISVLFITIKQVHQIGNIGNNESAVYNYRMSVSYGNEETSGFLNVLTEFSYALSFIYIYIFSVNINISNRIDNLLNIVPVLLFIIIGVVSGSRFNIIKILCAGVIYVYFYHSNLKINSKSFMKLCTMLFLFLLIFYEIRGFVGRVDESNLFSYLSSYVGGSIKLFDMFIQSDYIKNGLFGQESLYSINRVLIKLGLINYPQYSPHLEFRFVNNINLGNVYTGFRRVINDYGAWLGMIVIYLMSLFYSMYYKILKLKFYKKDKLNYSLFYYGMIVYVIITYSINDNFTMGVISINFIESIIYTLFFFKLLLTIKSGEN